MSRGRPGAAKEDLADPVGSEPAAVGLVEDQAEIVKSGPCGRCAPGSRTPTAGVGPSSLTRLH